MPIRTRSREKAREYRIRRQRRLNAIQRELEYAAAQAAAAERAAKRAEKRNRTQAPGDDHIDYLRLSSSRPAGCQPDYGDDPPPF